MVLDDVYGAGGGVCVMCMYCIPIDSNVILFRCVNINYTETKIY